MPVTWRSFPKLYPFPWGCPFAAAPCHQGTSRPAGCMFPHSFCYSTDKKSKIETTEVPTKSLIGDSRAQMWFQVLGKDFICLFWKRWSWKWRQCAHLRWRKMIVGNALWVLGVLPGISARNMSAEQRSRLGWATDVSFLLQRSGSQLLLNNAV